MKIGFTGTRKGMTAKQRKEIILQLSAVRPQEFHHGDCVGADHDAHAIIRTHCPAATIVLHPPKDPKYRAFCVADKVLEEKEYLKRNKDIVHDSDLLVAAPGEKKEKQRSGTWSTIRYAKWLGRTVVIFFPDGTIG